MEMVRESLHRSFHDTSARRDIIGDCCTGRRFCARWAPAAPANPCMLLAASALLLPAPLHLFITSFRELVGRAPQIKLPAQEALEALIPAEYRVRTVRTLRQGRTELLEMWVGVDPATTVDECDALRRRWEATAEKHYPNTYVTMVFSNIP